QVRPSDVTKLGVIDAFLAVPREEFVSGEQRAAAYIGEHLPLAPGRVILDARSLSKMVDALALDGTELVLDIGCGLGYSTAILARLAQGVVGLEDDADRAAEAQENLTANGADSAIVEAGPLNEGRAEHAPFDVIIVQGAVAEMPAAICDQLAEGGRIVALFQEGSVGTAKIGYKIDGEITWRRIFDASAPVLPGFEREVSFVL
ncbi:MAG: protein-L-isoaspartate O-methyltransferase family protein, partial [Shimia sp.]